MFQNGINRQLWDQMVKVARIKHGDEDRPDYRMKWWKPQDHSTDEEIVAKYMGVSRSTTNHWHRRADTKKPVHGCSIMSKVIGTVCSDLDLFGNMQKKDKKGKKNRR